MTRARAPVIVRAGSTHAAAFRALLTANASAYDADEELSRSHAVVWLAQQPSEDSPSGFLLGWEIVDELEILDVFVLPPRRRQGLAQALLEAALGHARSAAKRAALLEVRCSNLAAQKLYEKLGFRAVGERKAYYADGEDALLLRLEL